MAAAIDVLDPANPKRVLLVASNPTVSEQTGWPIGFWWSELTHPYWELSRARLRDRRREPRRRRARGRQLERPARQVRLLGATT